MRHMNLPHHVVGPRASKESQMKTVELTLVKTTKNTFRYEGADEDAAIGDVYVAKTAFPEGAPQTIRLTIEAVTA
jgi:hypothetical protein